MKLKVKLALLPIIFVFFLGAIGHMAFVAFEEINTGIKERDYANKIVRSVLELEVVTYEYLMHHGDRMIRQWEMKYNSLNKLFKSYKDDLNIEDHDRILELMQKECYVLEDLFVKLQQNYDKQKQFSEEERVLNKFNFIKGVEQRIMTQIMIRSQRITDYSFKLSRIIQNAVDQRQVKTNSMILNLVWFFAFFSIIFSIFVIMSILRPLASLQKGMRVIGEGNLDYRVEIKAKDEIGQLARAFNQMTEQLTVTTSSRNDLNDQIKIRKKIEKDLELARINAEVANQTKSRFLANMSHELRTPLNAVIGFSQVLNDGVFGSLNKKQQEYVLDINESGHFLLLLINDILDLSKIEAGKLKLDIEKIEFKELCESCLKLVREKGFNSEIKFLFDCALEKILIDGDSRRLKQVVYNLLSNAIKFTPPGGQIGLEIKLKNDHELIVCVWDTGIGIDEKDKSKVFSEFEQVKTDFKPKGHGTGLGMSLAKRIIEMHNGKIWFESKGRDQGTYFYFTLPLLQAQKSEVKKSEAVSVSIDETDIKSSKRVLVIEDCAKTSKLFKYYLQSSGYSVETATNARDALDKAEKIKPDVITLDLILPDKSGWQLFDELKKNPVTCNIPVLIVSILDEDQKGFLLGASGYIKKPVDKQELLKQLSDVVSLVGDAIEKLPNQ